VTFAITTLLFPVSTTWGTFQHAAGAVHVLVVISAVLALDALIDRIGRFRGWTRPVAWLGPTLTVSAALLLTFVILPSEGSSGRTTEARLAAMPEALARSGVPLASLAGPVITDVPIWFAEVTGHTAIELPDEDAASIVDLAAHFGAELLVVRADNGGRWPEAAGTGGPGTECLVPLPLAPAAGAGPDPDPLADVVVFRIACPAG